MNVITQKLSLIEDVGERPSGAPEATRFLAFGSGTPPVAEEPIHGPEESVDRGDDTDESDEAEELDDFGFGTATERVSGLVLVDLGSVNPVDGDDEDAEWQERALCAQTDPEAFFPEKGGSTREAKRICSGCDVRAECLDYALAHDERFGIWGGLSERERRRIRRVI